MQQLKSLPEDIPFLTAICWQADPNYLHRMEPLEILQCYERGWEYLDVLAEPSPDEWQFIQELVQTYSSWLATDLNREALAQQKIDARLKLLDLPPLEAQRLADQTLYPQLWESRPNDTLWDESIPSNYGETDP